ncbi:MAG: amidohydrolase family protein [Planctomycetota bacterium]|nr:amidohydrolase family protein [Planctomycetota bacterium]
MPIVDSHVHIWNAHPLDELLLHMEKAGVHKAIAIGAPNQADPQNNEVIAECVRNNAGRIAALAALDLKSEDILERVNCVESELGFQGVSDYLSPDDPLDWFLDATRKTMWEKAEQSGFTVSLSIFPEQHSALREVARTFPDLRFMLCHMGRPDHQEQPPYPKFQEVLRTGDCQNVFVKISGFYAYTSKPWDFPYYDVHKWVRMILSAYGPERMCWGSDFSPVLNHSTYRQSLEAVRSHASYLSESDLEWVLGKAAMQAVSGFGA